MKLIVGSDTADPLVERVVARLERAGHTVEILPVAEWPKVAKKVAHAVAGHSADQGVLFCWTGTGTAMAANKVRGARAALAWDPWIAEGARRWNDANILVLSLKRTSHGRADEIVDAWLSVEAPDADELKNIRDIEE
jgi:ribose 5-phosphate isomerase B